MTTAEKYRQLEKSPSINIARYIFSCVKKNATISTLGNEIIEIKTGKTPSKQNKRFYEDDYLKWFKPDEVGSEKYLFESKDKLSKFAYENNQATVYEPDTILINAIGDVGRISILKVKASSNQQITGIRLNKKIDVDYAYFYLLANRHFFYVDLFQTTLPIVNQKKINSIPFVYPEIVEQRNIVEGLVEIDKINSVEDLEIIEKLNWNDDYKNICRIFFNVQFNSKNISIELTHQFTLVKKLRQQLLQDAVQGKLVEQKPNDEPAYELLKKIKAEKQKLIAEKKFKKEKELLPIKPEEIPFEIPENWVWCRGEIVASYIDPQPSHRTPPESQDGVPYIAMSDIKKDGSLDFNSARKVSKTTLEEHQNRYKLQDGDFIFGKIGTIGKPVKLPNPFNYTLSANIILIQPERRIVNQDYLFYFLSSPAAEKNLLENKSTMSYPVFGMGKARNMPIPLPPLAEQIRIVQKLDELIQYCNELEESIKQSESQNEKLLQQVLREALRKEPVEV
jgi:type I restriction enzyme S subunit